LVGSKQLAQRSLIVAMLDKQKQNSTQSCGYLVDDAHHAMTPAKKEYRRGIKNACPCLYF
jgi:hypothetical protein